MGFPIHKAASRAALIGVMLGGGLLYAGISQAQDAGVQVERDAELVAAAGGPAPSAHLIPYAADKAAVDVREEDVDASHASANAAAPAPVATVDPASQPRPVMTAQAAPAGR